MGSMSCQAKNEDVAFTVSGTNPCFTMQYLLFYNWCLKSVRWLLPPGEYRFLYCRQMILEVRASITRNECWLICNLFHQNMFSKRSIASTGTFQKAQGYVSWWEGILKMHLYAWSLYRAYTRSTYYSLLFLLKDVRQNMVQSHCKQKYISK